MDKRAVTAAVMSCCVLLSCGCSAKNKSNKAEKADRPATWTVEQISLDEITPLDGEENVFITRDEDSGIGLAACVRLHIDVFSSEQFPGAFDSDGLDFIDEFAAAVITVSRITFCILVRQNAAHCRKHSRRHDVLGGYQLDVALLAFKLFTHRMSDLWIALFDQGDPFVNETQISTPRRLLLT